MPQSLASKIGGGAVTGRRRLAELLILILPRTRKRNLGASTFTGSRLAPGPVPVTGTEACGAVNGCELQSAMTIIVSGPCHGNLQPRPQRARAAGRRRGKRTKHLDLVPAPNPQGLSRIAVRDQVLTVSYVRSHRTVAHQQVGDPLTPTACMNSVVVRSSANRIRNQHARSIVRGFAR